MKQNIISRVAKNNFEVRLNFRQPLKKFVVRFCAKLYSVIVKYLKSIVCFVEILFRCFDMNLFRVIQRILKIEGKVFVILSALYCALQSY